MSYYTIINEILVFVPNPNRGPMELDQTAIFEWSIFEKYEDEEEARYDEAEPLPKTWHCRGRIEL